MDGRRIREGLGFAPAFPRLAEAMAARAIEEDAHAGGYFQDYGFVRLSVGVGVSL
jgi:hypothetical protein